MKSIYPVSYTHLADRTNSFLFKRTPYWFKIVVNCFFRFGVILNPEFSKSFSAVSYTHLYYNKSTDAYCYIGTEKPNHDVVIVGWDDSYSKDNFRCV